MPARVITDVPADSLRAFAAMAWETYRKDHPAALGVAAVRNIARYAPSGKRVWLWIEWESESDQNREDSEMALRFPVHDPAVNCNCGPDYPPGTTDRCEYAMLSDAVIEAFNPRDDDAAEVAICIDAIERAAAYIGHQDCDCTPEMVADREPCARCEVLGQLGKKPVDR